MMEAKSENNVYKFYLEGSGSTKYKKDDSMGSNNASNESAMDEFGYEVRLENGVPNRKTVAG